jgi:uroporphyrinogen-III synthase
MVLVGIKTKELLKLMVLQLSLYGLRSELAEIITRSITKKLYFFKEICGNLARSIKSEGITFNEIEVYQTTLAPFKISIRKILME